MLTFEIILENISRLTRQLQDGNELVAIIQNAITTARTILDTDRILIYRFLPEQGGVRVFESVATDSLSILNTFVDDPCLDPDWMASYQHGQTTRMADIHDGTIDPYYLQRLEQLQVKANLVVPIMAHNQAWGLFIVHHCRSPKVWQVLEVEFVQHLALQLGLAIQYQALIDRQRTLESQRDQQKIEAQQAVLALQANQDAVWILQVPSKKVWFSPRWKEIRGWSNHEMESQQEQWVQGIHPEDCQRVTQALEAHLADPTSPYEQEYRVRHQDGSYRWILDRGQAIQDEHGHVIRMAGTETDITEKKQAELAQKASEEQFRLLSETAQRQVQREKTLQHVVQSIRSSLNLNAIFTTATTYIAEFLHSQVSIVQYLPAQGCWRPVILDGQGIPHSERSNTDIADLDNPLAAQLKQGQVVQIDDTRTLDDPINRALAHQFPGAWLMVPITVQGVLWGSLSLSRSHNIGSWQPEDIDLAQRVTDQLAIGIQHAHLYQQLQTSEARLSNVLDNVHASITQLRMYANHDWIHDYISSGCQALFGYAPEDFKQNKALWVSQVFPEDQERTINFVFEAVFAADTRQMEYRFCHPDGSIRWISETFSSQWNEAQQCWIVTILSLDITAHKATELALKTSQQNYRNLVENSPDIIERFDTQLRHLYVNSILTEITGIPAECFVGKTCRDLGMDPAMVATWEAAVVKLFATQEPQTIEFISPTLQGIRSFEMVIAPECSEQQTIESILCISRDITERKAVEAALREQQQFTEEIAQSTLAILYVYDLTEHRNIFSNQQIEAVLGYSVTEIQAMGDTFLSTLVHPDDLPQLMTNQQQLLTIANNDFVETEYRLRHRDGTYRWLLSRDRIFKRNALGLPEQSLGIATDITILKENQSALAQQTERQRLLLTITQAIRQTLDLDHILATTVTQVRQFLQTDRVVIFRFEPDWSGIVIAESVAEAWPSILGMHLTDTYFVTNQRHAYDQGHAKGTDDIYTVGWDPCYVALLEQMQVRAKLIVPIRQDTGLWGLLVAQHCQGPRRWDPSEIELQEQLALQIAIAIQQANLYGQSQRELAERQLAETALQRLNVQLEERVEERTQSLLQQAEQERLLRMIIQNIHRSLNLEEILTTVLEETRQTLKADRVAIYQFNPDWSGCFIAESVGSEWIPLVLPGIPKVWEDTHLQTTQGGRYQQNETFTVNDIYTIGHSPCHIELLEQFQARAYVIAPILLDNSLWGLVAIYQNSGPRIWLDWEISLFQQLGIQTAIALRQVYLFKAVQRQVEELERLNRIKDDFLSTVSHELRSPMSTIKMATQMLELTLGRLGLLEDETTPIHRYLKILREEEQREISLINDLLDLARLDAGADPLTITAVNLQFYIPELADTFHERTQQLHQQLTITIANFLPVLKTDLTFLERILTELLHNACKYTPAGERIHIAAQASSHMLTIQISNSGVEIPPSECERVFDKFYRIPNNDPWKHGGTGLGLALVKKLTERLGARISVTSGQGRVTFSLEFDLLP